LSLGEDKELVEISGNTLRVYFYLFKRRQTCGVREIQRALGFSSSSSAHYHLEKLASKGVLTKDLYGNYRISEQTRVKLIDRFYVVRGVVLPKQVVYASATSVMCMLFLLLFWNSLTLTVVLALLPGVVASGILWYDAGRLWSSLPSFKRGVR